MCALPYMMDSLSKCFWGLLRAQPCFGRWGCARWFGAGVVIVTVVSLH